MQNHKKFMKLAIEQAGKALKEGEFPVGCVIVKDGEVIADGGRKNTNNPVSELDHAEMIALRKFLENNDELKREGAILYTTMEPCLMCFSTLILNGIHKVVFAYEDVMGGGTNLPISKLSPLYKDLDIEITPNIEREESLELFQEFFSNPDNTYWKNSLLSSYTLKQ